jgi:hypothetical protein
MNRSYSPFALIIVLLALELCTSVSLHAQTVSQSPSAAFTSGAACSPNGALSYNGNSFVVCTSGAWVIEPVTVGAGGTCTIAGQLQWTGSALQVCNGSSWVAPSAAAGGSNTDVQYNSSGSLAGSSNFVFTGTSVGIGTSAPYGLLNVASVPVGTSYYGLVSIGTAWNGGTAAFSGNAGGTVIAANAPTGFGGNLVDLQIAGSSYYAVGTAGPDNSSAPLMVWRQAGSNGLGFGPGWDGNFGIYENINISGGTFIAAIGQSGVRASTSGTFSWGSGSQWWSQDTDLSRLSAGVVSIGTGPVGDYAGTLIAGSVGIGTATPPYTVTVAGDLEGNRVLAATLTSSPQYGILLRPDSGGSLGYNQIVSMASGGNYGFQFVGAAANGSDSISGWNITPVYMTITQTGSVGIGSTAPMVTLDLSQKTDALALPVGTTTQRPAAAPGMIRYNATLSTFEGYGGSTPAWGSLGGSGLPSGATQYQMIREGASAAQWENAPYDLPIFMPGTQTGSAFARIILPRAIQLPASLPSSQCLARTAATGSTTVTLNKISGGVTTATGTAVWSAAATGCSFTFLSNVTFTAGDMVEFAFPASPDPTLSDIAITLAGIRQ